MTAEEKLIEDIASWRDEGDGRFYFGIEEFADIVYALKKQIPQKPHVHYIPDLLGKYHHDMKPAHAIVQCPVCYTRLRLSKSRDRYCWQCGQKLNWELLSRRTE